MRRTAFSRRQLLAGSAAWALAAGFGRSGWGRAAAGRGGRRVAVVGGGLAGLCAAYELAEAGYEVTVFEAGARPGGRVRTLRDPFADGLYAEAGAMTVPASHDLTRHYAGLFDLPLSAIPAPSAASLYYLRGRRLVVPAGEPVPWPVELTAEEREMGAAGMQREYWGRELEAVAGADRPGWPPPELLAYDRLTLAGLWRRNGASEGAVAVLRFGYLDLLGDGVDSYSALDGLREASLRLPGGVASRFEGGNDRLPAAFAARLGPRLVCGAEVVRIAHRAGSQGPRGSSAAVRLAVRDAAGVHEAVADHLVLAVPFAVLRAVAVEPAFSPGKARAIATLRNTSVTRVFLQVRRRFWEAEGLTGTAMTDLPVQLLHPAGGGGAGPRGVLEVYTAGEAARRLAAMAPAERIDFAVRQAAAVFPGLPAEVEGGASVSWDDEPFARGAYAWFAPGEMTDLLPHLARPEGRVHFAGDHTSSRPGWMQGALESGRRAAAEIVAER